MNQSAPVLLIEDNADDAVLLQRALFRAGITNPVCSVDSVSAAVRFLEEHRRNAPVFVVISLDMFLASGEAVFAWMKVQDFLQQVPVIAIGSGRHPEAVQRAYDLGVNAYFAKQLNMNQLAKMIRELEFLEDIFPNRSVSN